MNKNIIIVLLVILVLIIILVLNNQINKNKKENVEPEKNYNIEIVIEDYGTIKVELYTSKAPITVKNFVKLVKEGYYDGLTFHRIMEGFMMQGGYNPNKQVATIKGEFSVNGVNNTLSHTRGAISMARSDNYNSASSGFFIVHEDSTFLDTKYAAFGYVTEGMEVVDKICSDSNPIDDNGTIPEDEQPIIKSIRVIGE